MAGRTLPPRSGRWSATTGARYAVELSRYSDRELLELDRDQVLAEVRAYRAAVARIVKQAHEREVTR